MREISIREPIWKTRSVGIAEYKITEDLLIEIEYVDKQGKKPYPHQYIMKKDKALTYPTQKVRGNVLRIIPIGDLTIINGS